MAEPSKLGPFTGVTNRREKYGLYDSKEKTYALWAASNVDVSITGRVSRRAGFALDTALTSGDSLWSDGVNMYYRDDGNLYRDGTLLVSVAGRLTYEKFPGGGVIYSDTSVLNFISTGGVVSRLAPAQSSAPTLASTTGSLQPAKYIVSVVGVSSDSIEGPASVYETIELAATGGITVTLPALPDGAAGFNVYVSGPNGDILTYATYTTSSTYDVTDYATGRTLHTANKAVMPPGSIARIYNGRLLVASSSIVFVSDPYNFGIYDPTAGYLLFPATVTNIVPMQNGVYIVADKTYWVSGADIREAEFFEVLPYGGIAGSDAKHDTSEVAYWMTPKGLVVGDINGSVKNIQEEALALNDTGTRGATLIRTDLNRIVVVTNG